MGRGLCKAAGSIVLVCALAAPATAHETDQFTVPVGKRFADLGDHFTEITYDAIEAAVEKTNANIRRAQEAHRSAAYIRHMQSPAKVTAAVFGEFVPAFFLIEGLENMAHSRAVMRKYPGRIVGYRETIRNIYQHVHFPLDPRQLFRMWHASTIEVYGIYLGPDKIGHFTDMGYHYYLAYRRALDHGVPEAEAVKKAIRVGTKGILFGEIGMVGYLSAGAYSNADLASNYVGFKFYRNLTEETLIRGKRQPPMLTKEGGYWRISPHLRPDSGFLRLFFTDHFNEALNPSLFEAAMRKPVREAVRKRAGRILQWYADDNGNRKPKAYFDARAEEFRTYFGEDYGHQGSCGELITIGNTCFEDPAVTDSDAGTSPNGYTALHRAALLGDTVAAARILQAGASVDATVQSLQEYSSEWGDTPLHTAAAAGHLQIVELLLDRGADVSAVNQMGATPLHRAIDHAEVVRTLLAHGADADAADERGRTPLSWLARYPQPEAIALLIDSGADPNATDHRGETPLHRAALWGSTGAIEMLLAAGAEVNAQAYLQTTPLHFAVRHHDPASLELLLSRSADVAAADEVGWTALHDVAARGKVAFAHLLLAAGADPNATDHYGSTPLHQAARRGHLQVAVALVAAESVLNIPNTVGLTPLHEAVAGGHRAVVDLFLAHGADVAVADSKGWTAFDLATSKGDLSIRAILLVAYQATGRGSEGVHARREERR